MHDCLDKAYGAFGAAWNDSMVARRSVSPLGTLWPTMDAAFGSDDRLQHDIAGTLGNGSWGYIVGTYDKDAGPGNQRLHLNGAQ
jgi:hypothetical protein